VKNSHLEQHTYNYSSDYMVLIHHIAPDRHMKRYNWKGRHTYVNRTTLQPMLDLSVSRVSRLCMYILGSPILTFVYCTKHTWIVPTPYANFDMAPDRHVRLHN
jgi:hypothetical protein